MANKDDNGNKIFLDKSSNSNLISFNIAIKQFFWNKKFVFCVIGNEISFGIFPKILFNDYMSNFYWNQWDYEELYDLIVGFINTIDLDSDDISGYIKLLVDH